LAKKRLTVIHEELDAAQPVDTSRRRDSSSADVQNNSRRRSSRALFLSCIVWTVQEHPEHPLMANLNPDREKAALYLEDLQVGQRFVSGKHRIDEEQIRAFAEQFDPQPFHLDAQAAKTSLFKGLVASGWHTAAVTMRLLVDGGLPIAGGLVGAGVEVAWPSPVRPGAVLLVESEVLELRPSRSRPDRGMATVRSETRNESGEVVQLLVAKLVVPRRKQQEMPGALHPTIPKSTEVQEN
jgi:acyl dehydratase